MNPAFFRIRYADAQVLGHHAVVVEVEGLARAGKVLERALGDRLRDALLDDAVQESHGGQWRGGM